MSDTDSSNDKPQQLPLQVSLPEDAQLDALYAGANEWFRDWLQANWSSCDRANETSVVIEARPGYGCTHWLQAICRQGEDAGLPVFYLNLADVAEQSPEVLQGMSTMALLCLDDVDQVLGKPDWDEALFHLFNEQRERGHRLAIGVQQPLSSLRAVTLPDLHSRLTWGLRVALKLPEDEIQWENAILWLANQRGLSINEETAKYLALRGPRDWRGLADLLSELDTEALAAKRRITPPFIRGITGW